MTDNRLAFHRYVERTLLSILRIGTLLRNDREIPVAGYRIRYLVEEGHSRFLSREERKDSASSLVAEHLDSLLEIAIPESCCGNILHGSWQTTLHDCDDKGSWSLNDRQEDDYTFSFAIPPTPKPRSLCDYTRNVLSVLLDVIDLIGDDGPVFPDSVAFRNGTAPLPIRRLDRGFGLGPRETGANGTGNRHPLHAVSAAEAPIIALARHWSQLSQLLRVQAESNSRVVIEGFCLRNNRDWVIQTATNPETVYCHHARTCNVSCRFCYLDGNPPDIAIARADTQVSEREIATRLKYYDPANGRSLFATQWEMRELFFDPHLRNTLQSLREKTGDPFTFITNGTLLDREIVAFLSTVKPVSVIVSVNSMDDELRMSLMNEKRSTTTAVVSALDLLAEHAIPFGVGLVAYPGIPVEKFEDTLVKLGRFSPSFIRVILYGNSRFTPVASEEHDLRAWNSALESVQKLRGRLPVPVITIPTSFEENCRDKPNSARIIGTVPGSPAAICGIRPDDVITRINRMNTANRWQAFTLLMSCRKPVNVELLRDGSACQLTLDPECETHYPYEGHVIGNYTFPLGTVMSPMVNPLDIKAMKHTMRNGNYKACWVITSSMIKPAIVDLVEADEFLRTIRVHYVVVRNEYLGGNICVLDMATVEDIATALKREMRESDPPDIIFLPCTGFNSYGRDISGRHWADLRRLFDIPICLLTKTASFTF